MRRPLLATGAGALLLTLAACRGITSSDASPASSAPAAPVSTSAGVLTPLVEPDNGVGKIYQLIDGARASVNLTMYELRDQTAEDDLVKAAARGVNVRVVLDQHLEKSRNTATYDYLAGHGVHVAWAPAGTTYHQKTLTVDGKTSLVMTLNMVTSDYAGTRDFAVLDTGHTDVSAITTTFDADFSGRPVTPPDGTDLVWSPTNSQATILAVINGAKRTLAIENEEMGDSDVTSALVSAARRGVDVDVVMTADKEWDSAFSQLKAAGVHVRTYPDSSTAMYIHAKTVIADAGRSGQNLFVGSENFSAASLDHNRELGIRTADTSVIETLSKTVAADYNGGGQAVPTASAPPAQSPPTQSPSAQSPSTRSPGTRSPGTQSSGARCGAPANPFGLTLCAGGQHVASSPSGVCDYFRCISSFSSGKGYMVECADGMYSMSGGREGACDGHGGPSRPVYRT